MRVNVSPHPNRRFEIVGCLLSVIILAISLPSGAFAQNVQYQKGTVDHGFRSDLKIDPSTLALNLQLPLKLYRGRAGLDVPVTLYYSSKLWAFEYGGYYQGGSCCEPSFTANPQGLPTDDNYTWVTAHYGYDSAGYGSNAGWTGSLDFPYVVGGMVDKYDVFGDPCQLCPLNQTRYVKRIRIRLPDGSTHELRRSDTIYDTNNSFDIGTYHSTDGSRLKYVQEDTNGAATLYMPDGSRYLMGLKKYIDRNGNTISFNNNGTATDTLGRTLGLQYVSGTSPGDVVYSLTGVNGTPAYYTFRYRNLGAAGVLTTPQALRYKGDMTDIGGGVYSPSLFQSGGGSRTTNPEVFNPVVLHEILLPNNTKYTFTYNLYGEMEKLIYPSGGYEKFRYDRIEALDPLNEPYAQANRGVVERWISPDGSDTHLEHWGYEVVSLTPYVIRTTAPDDSYSERVLQKGRGPGIIDYGFDDALAGMPLEERAYAASGQMLRRTLMAYDISGPLPGGHASAARDARLAKRVDILLEPGGDALTSTTTYTYEELNVIATSQHDYIALNSSTAQTGAIDDIPQGTPLRTTETTFLINDPNIVAATRDAYRARGLLSLPTSTRVRKGSATGPIVAQSSVSYDEGGVFAQFNDYSAVTGWTDPQTPYRGNPTTISQWSNFDGSTTLAAFPNGAYLTAHAKYDQCGNVRRTWDGRDTSLANPSQVAYVDAFSDGARNTYAFPTSMTTAVPDPSGVYGSTVAFTATSVYDFNSGQVLSTTDANAKTTSYDYTDPMNRLRQVTMPDTGRVRYNYFDSPSDPYVQVLSDQDPTRSIETRNYFDGLGRATRSFLYEGITSTPWLVTDTYYDNMGRVSKLSNPHRVNTASAQVPANCAACTTTSYDALGRILAVTTSDSAQVVTGYGAATTGTLGTVTTVTDQAGRKRRSLTDALGRLVRVDEPNKDTGSLDDGGVSTFYTYNVLGHLLRVDQGVQQRFFMYDSLGRLLRVRNPEQGYLTPNSNEGFPILTDDSSGTSNNQWSMGYVYDANGNLSKRKDARNIVTTYLYDALNRNTAVDYSDSTINPDITRIYDSAGNGKGRLRESFAGGSADVGLTVEHTSIHDYDAMGRPTDLRQRFKTNGTWADLAGTYQTLRTYDLAGHVKTQTYPSGRVVNYNYDEAGRLGDKDAQNLAFTGNLGGYDRSYSTGIVYSPLGGITKEKFGTDTPIYNKLAYNSRGQLAEIRASTSYTDPTDTSWNRGKFINWYSLQCGGASCASPDNNGNLRKQEILIPNNELNTSSTSWYQQFDYDSLNRLQRVHEYTGNTSHDWQQEYSYDRFGNRTIHQTNTSGPSSGPGIPRPNFEVDPSTNRLLAPGDFALQETQRVMQYDGAGNLKNDKDINGVAVTRAYDAENRMISETRANGSVAGRYTYNAGGQRVRREVGVTRTWQVYGFDGELLAEYAENTPAASPQKEYGYRNGQLLITAEAPATSETRTNVALAANGGVATASSSLNSPPWVFTPAGVIDGERKGLNWGSGGGWNDANTSFSDWVQVDFNGSKTIDEVDVFTGQDNYANPAEPTDTLTFTQYGLTQFEVQYWTGSAWATVPGASVTGNNKVWRKFTFAPISTTKIQVMTYASVDGYSRLTEVEAWGTATMTRTNAALTGAVSASSSMNSPPWVFTPAGVNDGDRKGLNWGSGGGWNDIAPGYTFPDWVQLDFNSSKTIDEIDVFTCQDNYANPAEPTETLTFTQYGLTQFEVQYWTGSAWATVPGTSVTGNNKIWRKFTFAPITTTKIRVLTYASVDGYSRLIEVEAWTVGPSGGGSPTANIKWLVADQLGTPRMVFDQTGALANVKRHDYLPFGEELVAGQGLRTSGANGLGYESDTTRQKFTSKERDTETGLDYFGARYYGSAQGRFASVDPIKITAERLVDPQRLNLYGYCRNHPLKYIDPDGEDLVLANALARARAKQVLAPGLTKEEKLNIRIERGKVELRDPKAIHLASASPAYRYLSQIINNHNLQLNYYAIAEGQTVIVKDGSKDGLPVSYSDVVDKHGLTIGPAGARVRSVIVPVGGAGSVSALPVGSGNMTSHPEDVIFAHEAYGHGLDNDAVQVENEYRKTRKPALEERSGEDHRYNITVTPNPVLIQTIPPQIITEIPLRPLRPVSPPPR